MDRHKKPHRQGPVILTYIFRADRLADDERAY